MLDAYRQSRVGSTRGVGAELVRLLCLHFQWDSEGLLLGADVASLQRGRLGPRGRRRKRPAVLLLGLSNNIRSTERPKLCPISLLSAPNPVIETTSWGW